MLRTPETLLQPACDCYVRLSGAELQELQLELQWTQWPAAGDVQSMGYAEWAGSLRGAVVSLGRYCVWGPMAAAIAVIPTMCPPTSCWSTPKGVTPVPRAPLLC